MLSTIINAYSVMDLTSRGMLQYIPATPMGVCPQGNFMQGMQCRGDKCSSVGVGCDGFIDSQGQQYAWNTPMWTHVFGTDKENGYAQCPPGAAVIGSKCYGSNCNELALACATFTSSPNNIPVVGNAAPLCRWSEVFSDQMSCSSGEVVRGVQCGGFECRMKRLLCCRVMRSAGVIEGGNSAPQGINPTTMSPGGISEPSMGAVGRPEPGVGPTSEPETGPISEPSVGGIPEGEPIASPELPVTMPIGQGYGYRPIQPGPEVAPENEPMGPGGMPEVSPMKQPIVPMNQGYGYRPVVSPMHEPLPEGGTGEPMPEGGMPGGVGEPMPEGGMPGGVGEPIPEGGMPEPNQVLGENPPMMPQTKGYGFRPVASPMPEGGMPGGVGEPMPESGMPRGVGEPMPEGGMPGGVGEPMPESGMSRGVGEPIPEGGMPEPNQVLGENQPPVPQTPGYGFKPAVSPMHEPIPEGGLPGGMGEPMPESAAPGGAGEPVPEGGMPGGVPEPNQVLAENQPMVPGSPMGPGGIPEPMGPGGIGKCKRVIRRKCRRRPGIPMSEPMSEPAGEPMAEPMSAGVPIPGMGMEESPKQIKKQTSNNLHKKEL